MRTGVSIFWLALGCSGLLDSVSAGDPPKEPQAPPPAPEVAKEAPPGPNFLVFLADDVGTDKIAAYGESPVLPETPNIDALASRGVLFRNAYAYPVCSATRSALLTGRYGRRTGMGGVVELRQSNYELPLDEITIPEALDLGGTAIGKQWDAIVVGKWHLSGFKTESAFRHPLLQGFDHHKGTIGNLVNTSRDYGERGNYYHYEKTVDGVQSWSTKYATVETADDAIEALSTMQAPWLLWVAFHAGHEPFDVPPEGLSRATPGPDDPVFSKEHAMIEAMDHEIGRVLEALGPRAASTTILFIGDNGTPKEAILPPFEPSHGKATLFEGGTGVPFIVSGPTVAAPGRESSALVHAVDLMPTLLEIAGVRPPEGLALDGVSFAPVLADPEAAGQRQLVFTERFSPIGGGPYDLDLVAVRDERYKLVRNKAGSLLFYDLQGRHDDGEGLSPRALEGERRARFEKLKRELERVLTEATFAH